ncbi:HEAT repeat domain-containing protein [Kitasatospora sp. NPDC002227]|uniref:HEAT repeat domain-containing protein n=1 Tax=Kitasatospora sp. NPDC002227 TaxID=3154773 RepID=UPI0033264BF7
MSGSWLRRWFGSPQSAAEAQVGGSIIQVNGVHGTVWISAGDTEPLEDLEAARQQYVARLHERYHRLDLEVLTPLSLQDEPLPMHLREVFVPQLVRPNPPSVELPRELLRRLADAGEIPAEELPPGIEPEAVAALREAYRQQPAVPVLSVLGRVTDGRTVLLGDPGAGKSTLARYLCLALAAGVSPGLEALAEHLPLIVELRGYAEASWRERTFEDYLAHLYSTEGLGLPPALLKRQLGEERTLVVFDGLDELFDPGLRDKVSLQIAAFAHRYPRTRVLVTSRVIGYRSGPLSAAGFDHYMLQDLDRAQIGEFTERWYGQACPADAAEARRLRRRVLDAVEHSSSVRELAGNPLLLTILAIIGRRRELPRDRRTVYQHAVEVLVEHWDPSKYLTDRRVDNGMPYISAEDRLELLRLVARRMQEGENGIAGNHIPGEDLVAAFEVFLRERYELPADRAAPAARAMLQQFRERNFILSRFGGEVYGFVHRAFLEYLAAADIAHRFNRERSLTEEQLLGEVFGGRWRDPAWQEVLLLLAGEVDERFVAAAVDQLLAADPGWPQEGRAVPEQVLLAARYLGEVRKLGLLTRQSVAVVDALGQVLEDCEREGRDFLPDGCAERYSQVAPVLAGLGPGWRGRERLLHRHLVYAGTDDVVGNSLGMLSAHLTATLLAGDRSDFSALRRWAASARATHRAAAVRALSVGWPGDPEVAAFLAPMVADDPDTGVRRTALAALANLWPDDDRAHEALGRASRSDPEDSIRLLAALHLYRPASTQAGRDDPGPDRPEGGDGSDPLASAKDQALNDPDPMARRAAFHILGQITLPGARDFLRDVATGDARPGHRADALDALRMFWQESPDDSALIYQRARHEADSAPRCAALRALGRPARQDPELLAFLLELAVGDADAQARLAATEAAEQSAPYARATALLVDRAANDPAAENRRTAYHLLAPDPHVPGLVELLCEHGLTDPAGDVQLAALAHVIATPVSDPLLAERLGELAVGSVPYVRALAVRALAANHLAEPAVRELLQDRAATDESEEVREVALYALARGLHPDAELAAFLRERAVEDADEAPRSVALRRLPFAQPDAAATIPFLGERAVADPSDRVRVEALRALAFHWPDDPRTAAALTRATADDSQAVREEAVRLAGG